MVNAAVTNRNVQTSVIFEPLSKVGTPDRFSVPVALKNKAVNEISDQPLGSSKSPLLALAASKQHLLPESHDFWTAHSALSALSAA